VNSLLQDKSNGYEQIAEIFMRARNPRIGPSNVSEWSRALPRGCAVLDLGCGFGAPITQVLADEGFSLFGVDASPTLLGAFRRRFPWAQAECAAVEESDFFHRTFAAVLAWGLMFLLPSDVQRAMIRKVARVLDPGGRFLFTAPEKPLTWRDALTDRESISLGRVEYVRLVGAEGLTLKGEDSDEGENHYYYVENGSSTNLEGGEFISPTRGVKPPLH
jgi:SAM-dependent methyltransferase